MDSCFIEELKDLAKRERGGPQRMAFEYAAELIANLTKERDDLEQCCANGMKENMRMQRVLDSISPHLRASTAPRGAVAITVERLRQTEMKGWRSERDDQYCSGQLVDAAICYALHVSDPAMIPSIWPWDDVHWKPRTRREDLIRAGALIAAEIDRLDRLELASFENGEVPSHG